MPGKKKGGAGKKSGKKAAKALEREKIIAKVKALQKTYPSKCTGSALPSGTILRECRSALEDGKPVTKFILESSDTGRQARPVSRSKPPKSADKLTSSSSKPISPTTATTTTTTSATPTATATATITIPGLTAASSGTSCTPPAVRLKHLMETALEVRYDYLHSLHVWTIPILDEDAVALALYMESNYGLNLKVLELRDTHLSPWAIRRLSRPMVRIGITSLTLDYNKMPTATAKDLCAVLQQNMFLNSVSFNYCQLEAECGESLGCMAAASQIKSLSLVGNRLQCLGTVDLVRPLTSLCDAEYTPEKDDQQQDSDQTAVSKIEGISQDPLSKETKPHQPQSPQPRVPEPSATESEGVPDKMGVARMGPLTPALVRLDIRDNAIDYFGIGHPEKMLEPIHCMRVLQRLILASPVLEEINLDYNQIGDGGARELLHALQQRKEDGFPPLKLIVTAQISPDTFQKITELSTPPKKKKKKRGKKKK